MMPRRLSQEFLFLVVCSGIFKGFSECLQMQRKDSLGGFEGGNGFKIGIRLDS